MIAPGPSIDKNGPMQQAGSFRRMIFAPLLALVIVATPALTLTAAAQDDYTPGPVITVDKPSPNPCDSVVFTGTGLPPNTEVPVTINGTQVDTVMTDADGNFTYTYVIPCDFRGTMQIIVGSSGLQASATAVISVAITATTTPLPSTGSNSTEPLARAGVLLVSGGGILLVAGKRRERKAA